MRSSYIAKILSVATVAVIGLTTCKNKPHQDTHTHHEEAQLYTCPMHPQIIRDKPGNCPICGMQLVLKKSNKELIIDSSIYGPTKPVNSHVISTIPAISPESGTRIYSSEVNGVIAYDTRSQTSISSRVSGRIERLLIRYNYQPVRVGQLIMEIYSPDLAAAQQELLFVARNDDDLLAPTKQRLQLLGMQLAQIDHVLKTGKILYRIPVYSNASGYILEKSVVASSPKLSLALSTGNGMGEMDESVQPSNAVPDALVTSPLLLREGQYINAGQSLFTIYQNKDLIAEFAFPPQLAAGIKRGQKLLFYPVNDSNALQPGTIGLIEPVLRNGENFTLARVYLNRNAYQVGQLLRAIIPIVYTEGWWLPKKAVWRSGNRSVVFKKVNDGYVPVDVQIGVEAKDMIQIMTNISDWKVAATAAYLVDSESFIKAEN